MSSDDYPAPRTSEPQPVVIGEVLFDEFPDGTRVLGGAPFNVAWHLAGFGQKPRFISRIGNDGAGREVRAAMSAWGLDTVDVQVDPAAATGRVVISQGDPTQPAYEIHPDQAWDHISPEISPPIDPSSLVYHGTLAMRGPRTRAAISCCVRQGGPVFVDCNLRPPWWTDTTLSTAVGGARWLKLNEHELKVVLSVLGLPAADTTPEDGAAMLCDTATVCEVIVTLGNDGAVSVTDSGAVHVPSPPVEVVDSVGAGDAFSAVLILGLVRGWARPLRLQRAAEFAAVVCRERGALVDDPNVYNELLTSWEAS